MSVAYLIKKYVLDQPSKIQKEKETNELIISFAFKMRNEIK
jgi:hypothetical protein